MTVGEIYRRECSSLRLLVPFSLLYNKMPSLKEGLLVLHMSFCMCVWVYVCFLSMYAHALCVCVHGGLCRCVCFLDGSHNHYHMKQLRFNNNAIYSPCHGCGNFKYQMQSMHKHFFYKPGTWDKPLDLVIINIAP